MPYGLLGEAIAGNPIHSHGPAGCALLLLLLAAPQIGRRIARSQGTSLLMAAAVGALFADPNIGLSVENLAATADIAGGVITVNATGAIADGGTLTVTGPVDLRNGTRLDLRATLNRVVLRDPGQRIVGGVQVLDPDPPPFHRRGAATRRADDLAQVRDLRDPAVQVERRGAVRPAQAFGQKEIARERFEDVLPGPRRERVLPARPGGARPVAAPAVPRVIRRPPRRRR